MCDLFGGGGNPDAAAAAASQAAIQQQQATTNANITQGQNNIDNAFSQFDNDYYNGITTAYENAENPQLTDQYNIANDQLNAALTGNGMGESSVGDNSRAQLEKTYATNQAQIADQGVNAANTLRTQVNNTEDQLSSMNATAANPSLAASEATADSTALVAPQAYPTLSNVFGSVLSPIASATKAYNGSVANLTPYPTQTTPTSGNGSAVFS
jgi:hypothetical protein